MASTVCSFCGRAKGAGGVPVAGSRLNLVPTKVPQLAFTMGAASGAVIGCGRTPTGTSPSPSRGLGITLLAGRAGPGPVPVAVVSTPPTFSKNGATGCGEAGSIAGPRPRQSNATADDTR